MVTSIDSRQARDGMRISGRRRLAVTIGVVMLAAATLVGCSSGTAVEGDPAAGSSMSASTTPTSGEQESQEQTRAEETSDSGDSTFRKGLPEGFPEDIPLPGFHTAKKIGGSADEGYWVVLLQLTDSTDTPAEDYTAQLEAAGYSVDDGGAQPEATNGNWDIGFHSAMAGTLTVSVMEA